MHYKFAAGILVVSLFISAIPVHASIYQHIENQNTEETNTEIIFDIEKEQEKTLENSIFFSEIDTPKKEISIFEEINNAEALKKELQEEITNRNIYKTLTTNKNRILSVYKEAESVKNIHPGYAPAEEKLNEIKEKLASADGYIKEYISTMENQKDTSELPSVFFPKQTETNIITKLKELKNESEILAAECEELDFYVDYFYGFYDIPQERKNLITTALSLEGKITYEWAGKPINNGWNERWNKKGNGLDCSGFVDWSYWTATNKRNENLSSTLMISNNLEQIAYSELLPGDLGMIFTEGTYYLNYKGDKFYDEQSAIDSNISAGYTAEEIEIYANHVGIYVGKDENNNDIWVHCQSGNIKTVTVGPFEKFVNYYRIPDMKNIK